jgi:3-mercaptopyruvate sulfurtransferase SseA
MDMGFTKAKVLKGGWQEWDKANYETDPKAK